jgi:hypothetical protein
MLSDIEQKVFSYLRPWLCASSGMTHVPMADDILEKNLEENRLMDKHIVHILLNVDTDAYFYDWPSMVPTIRKVLWRYVNICEALKNLGPEMQVEAAQDLFTTEDIRGLSYYTETKSGLQKFAGSLQSWAYHIILNGTHPITREQITRFVPITVGPRTRQSLMPKDIKIESNFISCINSSNIHCAHYQSKLSHLGLPNCFTLKPCEYAIILSTLKFSLLAPKQNCFKPGTFLEIHKFETENEIPVDRQFSNLLLLELDDDSSSEMENA